MTDSLTTAPPAPDAPPGGPAGGPGTGVTVAVAVALLAAVVGAFWLAGALTDDETSRQAEVAERGAAVMPFDLDRTTHVFDPTSDGGVQTVVSDPPVDPEQVALIRGHLREERDRFAAGDFGDPATIHGDEMPGLAMLREGHDRVTVTYAELPDGARLTYTTRDAALISALHAWFDAQIADHGGHAEHG